MLNRSHGIDLASLKNQSASDNVVDLLLHRLSSLPKETLDILSVASCFGHSFDLRQLAPVMKLDLEQCHNRLTAALREELLLSVGSMEALDANDPDAPFLVLDYKFQHDKVQRTVSTLMDELARRTTHYRIAHQLKELEESGYEQEVGYQYLDHLNIAQTLVRNPEEKMEYAQTHLMSARYAYQRWGADAKVDNMNSFSLKHNKQRNKSPYHSEFGLLDFSNQILELHQASNKAELFTLISKLYQEVTQAARLLLLRQIDNELHCKALWLNGELALYPSEADIPWRLINYVRRTASQLVFSGGKLDEHFSDDSFFEGKEDLIFDCAPLLDDNRLIGVIYSESHQAPAQPDLVGALLQQFSLLLGRLP